MKIRILATGESMSQILADSLRGTNCIAVNRAFAIAPWAMALVANDVKFWNHTPEAHRFAGRKFSTNSIPGIERVTHDLLSDVTNSGVVATLIAIEIFGAGEIELHGVDNRGGHFHGDHPPPLMNPDAERFAVFAKQWGELGEYAKQNGVRILNKTPGSALECFDRG